MQKQFEDEFSSDSKQMFLMEKFAKVLILEDDPVNAFNLKHILETNGFETTGIATNCDDAFNLFLKTFPDLIICCIYLNNGEVAINFVEQACEIKNVPVIYVSSRDDEETLNRAMDSSPASYITKPFTEKQLLVAAKCAVHKYKCCNYFEDFPEPTSRELEIIKHLALGKSTKEIADTLCIAYETVKSHRKNINKKFSVSKVSETVALAYQNRWLS